MLLRMLRNNRVGGYMLIIFLAVASWLPSIDSEWQPMSFDDNPMPVFSLLADHIPVDSLLSVILGLAIVMSMGFYLMYFNSRYQIIPGRTLLPVFFFILLASSIPSLQRLHPALISMVFFLPAIEKLLSSYKTERLSYNVFEASFLVGAGSLVYFNLAYFLIIVWVALLILRPVIWREWMFSILGIILPWVFFSSGYFLITGSFTPVLELVKANFILKDPYDFISLPEIMFFSFILFLIILASRHIINSMGKMKVLHRKIFVLYFWVWLLSVALFFFIETANVELLIPASIPVSFLLGHWFYSVRKTFWGDVIIVIIAVGVLSMAWIRII